MRKVKVKIGEEMNIEESEGAPPGVVRPNNQLMLWTRDPGAPPDQFWELQQETVILKRRELMFEKHLIWRWRSQFKQKEPPWAALYQNLEVIVVPL